MSRTYVIKCFVTQVYHIFYCGHTPTGEVLYNFNFLLFSLLNVRTVFTRVSKSNSYVHFLVAFRLCVITSLHSKNVFRLQVHFYANQSQFCTETRFETEVQGNSEIALWFCIITLPYWLKKLAPFFHPIRSQLTPFLSSYRDLLSLVFPRFASTFATCI